MPVWSALRLAAVGDCAEVVKLLCAAPVPRVPVNTVFDMGQTALHVACSLGRAKAALALIERGASAETEDGYSLTPLY